MKANRNLVLGWIGLSEGGYVDHPKDPGGPTDRGITQKTFDAWNRANGRSLRSVRGISKEEADQIIFTQYMQPIRFDDLPAGVDYWLADYSVNSGAAQAVRDVQRQLGLTVDGVLGLVTLAAIRSVDPVDLLAALSARRMSFLRGLKTWGTFGKGWTTRVIGKVAGAQDDDVGVLDRATKLAKGMRKASIPIPTVAAPHKASPEPPVPVHDAAPAAPAKPPSGGFSISALIAAFWAAITGKS